jgi:hypothetical protein
MPTAQPQAKMKFGKGVFQYKVLHAQSQATLFLPMHELL